MTIEIDDRYPEFAAPYAPEGRVKHRKGLTWGGFAFAGFLLVLLVALVRPAVPLPDVPVPSPSAPQIIVPEQSTPPPEIIDPPEEPITPPEEPTVTQYTVTFIDWDGSTISSSKYAEGTLASGISVPADPARPDSGGYRYIFYGWTPALADVTGDATYMAVYLATELPLYSVTFVDYDGMTVLLAAASYAEGTPASDIAQPATPTRAPDGTYTYTFSGWSPALSEVTGDVVYTAVYDSEKNKYTITWQNYDGSTIDTTTVEQDEMPVHANPTYGPTAQYTYTFNGWLPAIVAATADTTYVADYTIATRQYNVTFIDWDGAELLAATAYDYGTAAADVTVPSDPVRPSTAQYDYTFAGWSPALAATVTEDATYMATYNATLRQYSVTFVDEDGSTVLQAATAYDYGTAASDIAQPATPTKPSDAVNDYTFAGWSPDLAEVTGDVTYTATYTATPITYIAPTIELEHELYYWDGGDEYFAGFASDIALNDVAGATGQVKLMMKNPETGVWEQVSFTDTEYESALLQLYTTQGGGHTEFTPSGGPNSPYDIPSDAEGLEVVISKHIPVIIYDEVTGDSAYLPRAREVVKIAFDYTLPNGETGTVETEEFYLYNDWFFGSDDSWVADTDAKTLTLTFPYQVDRGGPIDYDNIYWHPHLYWQPADDYHWGTGGTELDMKPTVSYYTESDGRVFGKIVYTFDTLVPSRIYEFEADVIYSDYGVDDANHWDNWVVQTNMREMEFDIAPHEAPVIGVFSSAEYGGDSGDWHFGIGAVGCQDIPDDLKGGKARLKFMRYDESAGGWVDIDFISAAEWEANDAKPWSDPTKVEIGDKQMFFSDAVSIGTDGGSSTAVSTLANPTAMVDLGDSDYIIASMAYHLPLNPTWEPASTLIKPVMEYEYPDGTTGTAEGNPIRVYSGSFIGANSDYGTFGVVTDVAAKTISMDFIVDGGPYTIDPNNMNWGHSLHWQDVSDGSYDSERYKDPPDDAHGWVTIEDQPTMQTYVGTDGKTHVTITYQLDEINTDYAYDYRGTVYYFESEGDESGMWEAFPTQLYIRFS